MLASCHGRRSRAAGKPGAAGAAARWPLAPLAFATLSGCSESPAGAGAWAFAALALPMVAVLGYALGALRGRVTGLAQASALRRAHEQTRLVTDLHDGWLWQTDAEHRLQSWHGPDQAAAFACTLFEDAVLAQRLQAQRSFDGLRVRIAQPLEGSRTWALRATPRHDDLGRFAGFAGAARPLDALEEQQAAAAALPAALQLHGAAALLALDAGNGWRVQQFNAAAAARWPPIKPGAELGSAIAPLSPALRAALDSAAAADVEGWHVQPVATTAAGLRGLLLAQRAGGAETGPNAESDSFSFTVSHDLRAPIRVVEGFTRIVKEDYGRLLDRVGNDHLDRVLGAAARMNLMIDALLTLARLSSQPLARQPVNLSQLATYVVDDLRRAAPEREAEIEIEPALLVQGDPTLLRLVLENLLGNAWKYSARSPRAVISLGTVALGAGTAYVVRDNGAGFDMRSAERLFGLFQRLHSASEFPGHGVGLASVRRIVRRHGGDVWAESESGRGAAFYFTLGG